LKAAPEGYKAGGLPAQAWMTGKGDGLEKYFLEKEAAVLLIIDIQERLAIVMKDRERVVRTSSTWSSLQK
jgi:hypothetical protein